MTLTRFSVLVSLLAVLAAAALLGQPQELRAQATAPDAPVLAVTLLATSDAWLSELLPNVNNGSSRSLLVERTNARVPTQAQTLVQFDLSSIPAGAIIDSAELALYQLNGGSASRYTIYVDEVGAAWSELLVTWNTRPPAANRGDPPSTLDQTSGYKLWDVRQIVSRWLSGAATNRGFLFRGDGVTIGYREFSSRDLTGQEPLLRLTYHMPAATATSTATATRVLPPSPTATASQTRTATPSRTPTRTATRTPTLPATPTTPPLQIADLIAVRIEVTQAIQDENNSVPLVAGKRTFVRFYARSLWGDTFGSAQLTVQHNGATIVLNPIGAGSGLQMVRHSPLRGNLSNSFLFEIPSSFANGTLSLAARVKTPSNVVDMSPGNNEVSTQVSFESAPALTVVVYRIGYSFGGQQYYPSLKDVNMMIDWLLRAYPTPMIKYSIRSYFWGEMSRTWVVDKNGYGSWRSDDPSCSGVNAVLWSLWWNDRLTGKVGEHTRYYGMVDDAMGFMRGCSPVPSSVASGPTGSGTWGWDFDGSYGDWYGGHELGHAYGHQHANFCGATDGSYFPNPFGWISPVLSGPAAIYGFDAGTHAIYWPVSTDLMTYCDNEWISDYSYEWFLNHFQGQSSAAGPPASPAAIADRLLVSGTIDPATLAVRLQPLYVVPNAPDVNPPLPGPYAIVLRAAGGGELARYPFTPQQMEGGPGRAGAADRDVSMLSIDVMVPYIPDTVRVDIEGPDGALLKTVTAGVHAPVVRVLAPNGEETLSGDPITVSWTAQDGDGDPLTFSVQYSADNGATWQMATQGITGTTALVPRANISAGSQALFRVWATDGIHSDSDTSDATFELQNESPTVQTAQPEGNTTIIYGQTLALEAIAYDVDSGNLDGDQVQWASSLDGPLGSGADVVAAGLSIGTHIITVTAADGQGGTAEASLQVTVLPEEDLIVPPPVFLPVIQG